MLYSCLSDISSGNTCLVGGIISFNCFYCHFLPFNLFANDGFQNFPKLILSDSSLSLSSDGETFISADDLRINLWNLEISNQSFNIVDVKPANMEDLTGEFLFD